ncbi:LAFE_0F07910g1_1 [Lachancea fermentati]|uniref:LAFE_0F07910g1_1 n=1 Tax=Lachancea fermentati TaxID=4955 RepID=A0A1G4MF66_LACFM|nr:LAFE_0F07910g1_1 [Lachancea fermentati]
MKSPCGNKRTKALDVLDKHISHKRKRQKASLHGTRSMLNSITDLTCLPAPNEAVIQHTTPSPRVIRTVYSSPSGSETASRSPRSDRDLTSPMRKTVAFSDKLESSPPEIEINSSPQRSSTFKPAKSILKYSRLSTTKQLPDVSNSPSCLTRFKASSRSFIAVEAANAEINPYQLEYWVPGEVHSLKDINNINEFKSIIEGGLQLLNVNRTENKNRHFEIYATFNNIIPIVTVANNSEINNKKIGIIIDNLNSLLRLSISHLGDVQYVLLKALKKDPFVSRLYVQIVRFLSALLSNFKVVKSSENSPEKQETFRRVLQHSIEVLNHENSNKVMIAAQIALLREEKYGPLYLHSEQATEIINALHDMKEINSTNLTCEKLLLLKSFLAKYPTLMLKNIDKWLLTEILSRLLIEEELYSMKIAATCISVLLDVSKKSLDEVSCINYVRQISKKKAIEEIPQKFLSKLKDCDDKVHFSKSTLSDLLITRIKYFALEKKEYKLAMDFWLAMIGLIFNTRDGLQELTENENEKWWDTHICCLNTNDPVAQSMALKSWRIVAFVFISNITANTHNISELMKLLLLPLRKIETKNVHPQVTESIMYIIPRLLCITCCDTKPVSYANFNYYLEGLIIPLYNDLVFKTNSLKIYELSQMVLFRLLKECAEEKSNINRNFNRLKIAASTGVTLNDIKALPQEAVNNNWNALRDLALNSFDHSLVKNASLTISIINALIERLPIQCRTYGELEKCIEIQVHLLNEIEENLNDSLVGCLCVAMKSLGELMSCDYKSAAGYFTRILPFLEKGSVDYSYVVKNVQENSRDAVSEFLLYEWFSRFGGRQLKRYVVNLVGSKLLSPKISEDAFESLLNIINIEPSPDIIDNVLDLCTKIQFQVNMFTKLDIMSWNDDAIVYFVKSYTQRNNGLLEANLYDIMSKCVSTKENVFIMLCPLLLESGKCEIVKKAIEEKPKLLEVLISTNDPSFLKFLPQEITRVSLQHLDAYSHELKIALLQVAVSCGDFEAVFESYAKIEKVFLETTKSPVDIFRHAKNIMNELLHGSMKGAMWNLFNCLIKTCIKNEDIEDFVNILEHNKNILYEHIGPDNLSSMVNRCGKLNPELIKTVKSCFKDKDTSFNFELIRCFIERKKFQIFSICRNDFLDFIFDPNSKFLEEDKSKAVTYFSEVSEYVVPQNKKLMAELMRVLSAYLPPKDENFTYELLSFVCFNPRFNLKGYRGLIKDINDWKNTRRLDSNGSREGRKCLQYHFYTLTKSKSPSPNSTASLHDETKKKEESLNHVNPRIANCDNEVTKVSTEENNNVMTREADSTYLIEDGIACIENTTTQRNESTRHLSVDPSLSDCTENGMNGHASSTIMADECNVLETGNNERKLTGPTLTEMRTVTKEGVTTEGSNLHELEKAVANNSLVSRNPFGGEQLDNTPMPNISTTCLNQISPEPASVIGKENHDDFYSKVSNYRGESTEHALCGNNVRQNTASCTNGISNKLGRTEINSKLPSVLGNDQNSDASDTENINFGISEDNRERKQESCSINNNGENKRGKTSSEIHFENSMQNYDTQAGKLPDRSTKFDQAISHHGSDAVKVILEDNIESPLSRTLGASSEPCMESADGSVHESKGTFQVSRSRMHKMNDCNDDDSSVSHSLIKDAGEAEVADPKGDNVETKGKPRRKVSTTDCLRIPIFNSLKVAYVTKKQNLKHAQDEINAENGEIKTLDKIPKNDDLKKFPLIEATNLGQVQSTKVKTSATLDDETGKKGFAKLTFSTAQSRDMVNLFDKKSCALIKELKSYSEEDIRQFSDEEKKSVRMELLEFMLRLERNM